MFAQHEQGTWISYLASQEKKKKPTKTKKQQQTKKPKPTKQKSSSWLKVLNEELCSVDVSTVGF